MSNLIKLTFDVGKSSQLIISELMSEMNFTEESRNITVVDDHRYYNTGKVRIFITFVGKKSDLKSNLILCRKINGCNNTYFSINFPDGTHCFNSIKENIDSYEKYENIIKEI